MRKRCERGLAMALALVLGAGLLSMPAVAAEEKPYVSSAVGVLDSVQTWEAGDGSSSGADVYDRDRDEKDEDRKDDHKDNEKDDDRKDRHKDDGKDDDREDHHRDDEDEDREDGRRDDDDDDDDDEEDRREGRTEERKKEEEEKKKRENDTEDQKKDEKNGNKADDMGELPSGVDAALASKKTQSSHIQGIVKSEKGIVDWGERIEPPDYASSLYDILVAGVESGANPGSLVQDNSFTLPSAPVSSVSQDIVQIERVDFDLADVFASEGVSLGVSVFEDEDFFQVNPALSDQQVDYASLQLGDVVRTATYNGIFVTSIPKTANYDQEKETACSYISTAYQAFDRDHPEVFWLSGKCRVRITVVRSGDGAEYAYFFLVLADNDGFTMRAPDWTADGAVTEGIRRRDAAVAKILSTVTADTPAKTVQQLNRWLTENNGYNTTPDLTTISNEPHECLMALEGGAGSSGPVCDGYARAFKVLCDAVNIPCVLENGYAKTSPDSAGVFHMWNAVKIDNNWYGVDVTWNDPVVAGVSEAKSGKENEQYLLVGATTVIREMAFADSHPATNQASQDGVSFDNGPTLCSVAFSIGTANAGLSALPFSDVPETAWCYDAVSYVYQQNLMLGTSPDRFSPNGPITRQQLWMILARADGMQPSNMDAAQTWAVAAGVSDNRAPDAFLTREQLITMLWRYAGSPASKKPAETFSDSGTVSSYAVESMDWAVANGIVTGTEDGAMTPKGNATRAQVAVIIQRFLQKIRDAIG